MSHFCVILKRVSVVSCEISFEELKRVSQELGIVFAENRLLFLQSLKMQQK